MYPVAVLVERDLQPLDADQLVALHEGLEEQVVYHLVRPVQSSSALIAASLGGIGPGVTVPTLHPETVESVQHDLHAEAHDAIETSLSLLAERGQEAHATLTEDDPVDALADLVAAVGAAEAIVLTEPHVVREFLHLDWTSQAKRRLDVPTLHLLEHVPFSGQA